MEDIFRNMTPTQLRILFEAMQAKPNGNGRSVSKPCQAYTMICDTPEKWFRNHVIDDRDRSLLTGERAAFVEYSQNSHLRKIYHMKAGEQFKQTDWTVENDITCKKLVRSAGGQLIGYNFEEEAAVHWASATVNVNIQAAPGAGFKWGFLSTRPSNIRIFKGPPESCQTHAWDAMILRDCTPNTSTLWEIKDIASRKWDILVMKMCEDYDSPWIVVCVKDSGPTPEDTHDCQDTSECGCVIVGHTHATGTSSGSSVD